MVLQFMWRKDFLLLRTYLYKTADSYLCFQLALLHSVSYFFFLYRSPSLSLCKVSYSIFSNIDEVISINPSANVFVFREFNVHHKDWLYDSSGTDSTGEPCYNFSISNDLTQMVNFLLVSQTVILTVLLFWIYLFLLTLVFVLQLLSLHLKILTMLLSQFPLTSHHIHNEMPHFIALLMTILMLIGMVFVIIWEMLHVRVSLNSVLLLLAMNFASGFRLVLTYISLIEGIRSSFTHLHGFNLLVLLP